MSDEKSEITTKPKLSSWEVNFFAEHLISLLGNPNLPDSLQEGIINGLAMLEGEVRVRADKPEVVKHALVAYATSGFKIKLEPNKEDLLSERTTILYDMIEDPEVPDELKADLKKYIYGVEGILVEMEEVESERNDI